MSDIAIKKAREIAQIQLFKQLKLPMWKETERGVPNGILRSALFGAIGRGRREFLRRVTLKSTENTSIIYTGIRLCQIHLDLWECLIHVAREQQLGNRCMLTTYQLLKTLGKKDTGGNRKVLRRQLSELQATAIEIVQGYYTYSGSLIEEAFYCEKTGGVIIILNKRLIALYQNDSFTKVSWKIRRDLKRPLAKWLHGFYSTHRQPYPYSVEKIHALCGSIAKSLKKFEEDTLIASLQELTVISQKHGEFFSYRLEKSDSGCTLLHVSRNENKPLRCG